MGSLWGLQIEPSIRVGKGLGMVCNIPGTEVQGCYVTSKILFVFSIFSPNCSSPEITRYPQAEAWGANEFTSRGFLSEILSALCQKYYGERTSG